MTTSAAEGAGSSWFLYLVRCQDGQLYTGITTDVERRFREHSTGVRGARFLRGRGPLSLVYSHPVGERGEALRLEHRVKRLRRQQKEALVQGQIELRSLLG